MRPSTLALVFSLLAAPSTPVAQPASQLSYEIRDIGSVDGLGLAEAIAINDRGDVVGWGLSTSGFSVPFYWSERTGFVKIFDDFQGIALDINRRGQVVGWVSRNGSISGFLWTPKSGLVDLGPLQPISINDRGDIIGQCESGGGVPCLISAGVVRPLDIPPGGGAEVISINERGDIIGNVFRPSASAAAIWRIDEPGFTVLESPPTVGFLGSIGHDINNHGLVVGTILSDQANTEIRRPVVWDRDGVASVSNSMLGDAININDSGVVTVQAQEPLGAFVWNLERGTTTVLPSLGGIDRPTIYNLNNRGQIVGRSSNPAEQNHAVVWDPIKASPQ